MTTLNTSYPLIVLTLGCIYIYSHSSTQQFQVRQFSAVRIPENSTNEVEIMKFLKKRAGFFLMGMKAQ